VDGRGIEMISLHIKNWIFGNFEKNREVKKIRDAYE